MLPLRGGQLRQRVGAIRCGDPGQGARGEAARLLARAIGQRILAALFLILAGRFVDDLFSADAGERIAGLRWSGAEGAAALARAVIEDLLGWQLDEAKRTSAAAAAPVLGVAVAAQCGDVHPEARIGGRPRVRGSCGARPARRAGAGAGVLNYGGPNREMDVRDYRGAAVRPAGALQGVQAGGQAELGRQCSLRPRVQMLPRAPLPTCAPEELALGSASEGGASVVGAIPARRAEESHPAGAGRAPAADHSVLRCHGARQARTSARARGGDRTGMRRRLAWAADAPDGRYFAAADISKGLRRWVKPRRTQAGGVHRARARRLLGEGAASAGGRVGASCRGLHAAIRVPAVAGGGAPVLR